MKVNTFLPKCSMFTQRKSILHWRVKGMCTIRYIRSTLLVLVLFAPFMCPQAYAQAVSIRIGSFLPDQSGTHKIIFKSLAERLNADSKGAINASTDSGLPFGIDPIINGDVDITFLVPFATKNWFSDSSIIQIPGLFSNTTEAAATHQKLYDDGVLKEPDEIKILGAGTGGRWLLHLNFRFDGLNSLAGKTISSSTPYAKSVLEELGATTVSIPSKEIASAMEKGDVDGTVQNWFGASILYKISQYTESHVMLDLGHLPTFIVMNREKYDSLSPEHKKLIDKYSGEWMASKIAESTISSNDGYAKSLAVKAGNSIVELDESQKNIIDNVYAKTQSAWAAEYVNGHLLLSAVKNILNK